MPPFLDEIIELRKDVSEVEELVGLEKLEASKITDPFNQKLAVVVCHYVCRNDGEVSGGELTSIQNMCEIWDVSYFDIVNRWIPDILTPIISEEEPEEKEGLEKITGTLTEIGIFNLLEDSGMGSLLTNDNDISDSDLLPVHSKSNSFNQAFACIYSCIFGSGDMSPEEVAEISSAAIMLSDLYEWSDEDPSPVDMAIDVSNDVLASFIGTGKWEAGENLPKDLMLKNIKKLAKKIDDKNLQLLIIEQAREVSSSDGIDVDEELLINILIKEWNLL